MLRALKKLWRSGAGTGTSGPSFGTHEGFFSGLRKRGFEPHHILDVGANEASFSHLASRYFPQARYTLLEPRREMAPALEAFIAQDPDRRRWLATGAASSDGGATLAVSPDGGSSSFLPGAEGAASVGWEAREVPTTTLDALLGENEPAPEFVKLDVEGLELDVLEGAGRLLGHTELFLIETSWFRFRPDQPVFTEVVAFMEARGYAPYEICWFHPRPLDGALGLADVAFARQEGVLRRSNRWE